MNQRCQRLPFPVLLAVPGRGVDANDECAEKGDQVWTISASATTMALTPETGELAELLEEFSTKGIKGGLTLSNPRIRNGKACVDVEVWGEIKLLGKKWKFRERLPVCVPIQGCHTVWDIGAAKLKICVRAPLQLCGELCVGKWGLEKCWDECIDLPRPLGAEAEACGCSGD